MSELIKLKNVTKQFETKTIRTFAVKNTDLTVDRGEYIAIEGISGSGKSTLLNVMGLIEKPTTGHVYLFGQDTDSITMSKLAKIRNKYFGFIFQNFNLIGDLTIIENVSLPLKYAGINKKERLKLSAVMLEKLGMSSRADHYPNQLSGGQQQRTAIARALINDPDIIFADEPTGNLDIQNAQIIIDLFKEINQKGTTICVVTHSKNISSQASRIIQIREGEIIK